MPEQRVARVIRSVQAGVRWLKDNAPHVQDGRAVAATISALVAAEKNPHSQLVQRLAATLATDQSKNGSWGDELWDTTWATRALLDAGYLPENEHVQRAIEFMHSTQDKVDGTWYEEPFETMLVLGVLFDVEGSKVLEAAGRALKWLTTLQTPKGLVVGARYTGMAISTFSKAKAKFGLPETVVLPAVSYLRALLQERGIWTGAAWSNYYALAGLLDAGATLDDPDVGLAVDWFLDHQDADGRWMQVSQVHDTAMAVIVLSRLLQAPIVDIPVPQVAVLQASRENGTVRVSFHPPGLGSIVAAERIKISDAVRAELGLNQQRMMSFIGRARSLEQHKPVSEPNARIEEEVEKIGRYAYGHLIPPRIQDRLEGVFASVGGWRGLVSAVFSQFWPAKTLCSLFPETSRNAPPAF